MKVYRIEMQVCATAYIKASSEDRALAKAKKLADTELMVDGLMISSAQFDNPDLPEVSLSPAMTIHGPWEVAAGTVIVEEVEA